MSHLIAFLAVCAFTLGLAWFLGYRERIKREWKLLVAIIVGVCVALFIAGCAGMIDKHTPPPADWPPLMVIEQPLDPITVQVECGNDLFPLMVYGGCVEYDFCLLTCTIKYWLSVILGHERKHCKGYQHYGDTRIADSFLFWQANNSCGMPVWEAKR